MARLYTTGHEFNISASGQEGYSKFGTISIVNTTVRSGNFAAQTVVASSAANYFRNTYQSQGTTNAYFRAYLNIGVLPVTTVTVMGIGNSGLNANSPSLTLSSAGKLALVVNGSQVGSLSSALSTGQWYRIEMHADCTTASGHHVAEALIDGSSFATSSTLTYTVTTYSDIEWGANIRAIAATATGTFYWDDIAVNNSSGAVQNGYPGAGSVAMLNPVGAGDSTQWTIAGSSPAATNWQSVNENPPDDAVTFVSESILNKSDFYTVATSPLGSSDTVNVVQVGGRFNNDTADATTSFQFQVEKASAGTVTKSSAIVPNSTFWQVNGPLVAGFVNNSYPITLYQDPDGTNWTQSTVNSMQIGIIAGAVGTHKIQVTNVWAIVDYNPTSGPPPSNVGGTGNMLGIIG